MNLATTKTFNSILGGREMSGGASLGGYEEVVGYLARTGR